MRGSQVRILYGPLMSRRHCMHIDWTMLGTIIGAVSFVAAICFYLWPKALPARTNTHMATTTQLVENSPGSINTVGQSGGTNVVNNSGIQPPQVSISLHSPTTRVTDGLGGKQYVTTFNVQIVYAAPIPRITFFEKSGSDIQWARFAPSANGSGTSMQGIDNRGDFYIQNASGAYYLTAYSNTAIGPKLTYRLN
jgi:hypothetical protein